MIRDTFGPWPPQKRVPDLRTSWVPSGEWKPGPMAPPDKYSRAGGTKKRRFK